MPTSSWPARLSVIRHGESAGNVARDHAEANSLERIDIADRDMDVPLSELGRQQARALGVWWSHQPGADQPHALYVSPYLRAQQTAQIMAEEGRLTVSTVLDERLREREFGILDGLTRRGITTIFPEESQRRTRLGKFYHRPPGGESWSDVALRVRSVLDDMRRNCDGEQVVVIAHQVVVLLFRYVIESMTEEQVLTIDGAAEVANCSVTTYAFDEGLGPRGGMRLLTYNETAPLLEEHAPVTTQPDVPAGPH
ncbi:MAG TPA: histidine phosphatase family protein [Mycobacteriales bacterium]|nr:histidine phosphatase family protein [Mycobacteriales bacterium]